MEESKRTEKGKLRRDGNRKRKATKGWEQKKESYEGMGKEKGKLRRDGKRKRK